MSSAMRCRSPSWACTMRRLMAAGESSAIGPGSSPASSCRVEVGPQDVQLAGDDVEPLQPGLQRRQISAACLVLGAKRIGPDRAKRAAAAVEPRAKLHPLLEVAPILLAELLGQLVHAAGVAAKALRRLGADAVEPLVRGPSRRIVGHGSP